MEEVLNVNHLNVSFSTMNGTVHAVRDVSFHLNKGEILATVGESGCGKTVMIKSILRLHDKTNAVISEDSQILFNGTDIRKMGKKELQAIRGNEIAMIFQDSMTSLNPTTRVGKQIMESLKIHNPGMSRQQQMERAVELLKLVEIPDPERRMLAYPHQLSGGMRQRIMIAIALSCNPKVLLADEPTTALDVTIQAQLLDLLQELKQKLDMSIILVTHDLNVVVGFADRIQVMYAGQIVEEGTCEEIMKRGEHPYTWALMMAVPGGTAKKKSALYTIPGTPPDLRLPLEQCPFASRCRYCMGICRKEMPERTVLSETHAVRCWLLDENAPKVEKPIGGEENE